MKKVLFFVNSFTGGGAERVVSELIKYMSMQYEVKVVLLYTENDYLQDLSNVCESFCLGIERNDSFVHRTSKVFRSLDKVNQFIGDVSQYCLISAHLEMSHILARMTKAGKKTFYVMHGAQWPRDPNRSFSRKMLIKLFYTNRDIIAVSQGIKEELVQHYGIDCGRCAVVNNPFDLRAINQLKEVPEELPSQKYILCVGRLNKVKRYDRAIRAFAQAKLDGYELCFLGKGEEEHSLKQLATDLGVSSCVRFVGFKDNPYAWMKNASLLLCTSDSEAFPMGLVEALACGTPVVAANCNYGPREILLGPLAAYLVDPIDDIEQYAQLMKRALTSYPVIEEELYSMYTIDNIAEKYLNLWSQYYE